VAKNKEPPWASIDELIVDIAVEMNSASSPETSAGARVDQSGEPATQPAALEAAAAARAATAATKAAADAKKKRQRAKRAHAQAAAETTHAPADRALTCAARASSQRA
jgi:hypothetical protein